MRFEPPGRSIQHYSSEIASAASATLFWPVGTVVQRLLDDMSDIWACAVVLAAFADDIYDVQYLDDGLVERGVCGKELRLRQGSLQDDPIKLPSSVSSEAMAVDNSLRALSKLEWRPGAAVERLLDDISNIWIGAIVRSVLSDEMYEIEYLDGELESGVDGEELRPRRMRLDLPVEVWASVGSCVRGTKDLCAFEQISLASRVCALRGAELWWCIAYHERFRRCGSDCHFNKPQVVEGDYTAIIICIEQTRVSVLCKLSWKERYAERQKQVAARCSFQSTDSADDMAYYGERLTRTLITVAVQR